MCYHLLPEARLFRVINLWPMKNAVTLRATYKVSDQNMFVTRWGRASRTECISLRPILVACTNDLNFLYKHAINALDSLIRQGCLVVYGSMGPLRVLYGYKVSM